MTAEIITIGDELLIGQVVDTNSAWMATRLNAWGIEVAQITSVHDNAEQIREALTAATQRADIVLCTGGLGPTKDDITKQTFCDFFHTYLIEDEAVKAHIHQLYANRPDVLNRLTATQWLVPANCTVIPNHVGSAPIMMWEAPSDSPHRRRELHLTSTSQYPTAKRDNVYIVAMPGVPYEMQYAMEHEVGEWLQSLGGKEVILHRTLLVTGIPESTLAIRIAKWEDALPAHLHLAYLPKDGIIRLRLDGRGLAASRLEAEMDAQITTLLPLLGEHLLACEDQPIEVLVGNLLKTKGQTVGSAESCTGGKIAEALNRHAGSSAFYWGSVIAYDNCVKENVLGVKHSALSTYGAVSEPVVRQMAAGARRVLGTDYALATSGIAGPDGGTEEKPVGTVWIALATPTETLARCFHLGGLREQITDRAMTQALIMLLRYLQQH